MRLCLKADLMTNKAFGAKSVYLGYVPLVCYEFRIEEHVFILQAIVKNPHCKMPQ